MPVWVSKLVALSSCLNTARLGKEFFVGLA
jgi:hypothetical protein